MTAGLKIAIIGAGSVEFTKRLVTDIVSVLELQEAEFALTDVSQHNLSMVQQTAQIRACHSRRRLGSRENLAL